MGASPSVACPDSCLTNKTSSSKHRGLHYPSVSLTELQVTSCPNRLTGAPCLGTQYPGVASPGASGSHLARPWLVVALQQSIEFLDNDVNPSIPTYTSMLALLKVRTIFDCPPRRTVQHGYPETLFLFSFAPFASCLLASDPLHSL